jgi:hypothetical protein
LCRKNNLPFFLNQIIFKEILFMLIPAPSLFVITAFSTRRFLQIVLCICGMTPLYPAAQSRYDVLITEFLPDPSPPVGLPEFSFIEIYNHSAHDYSLRNWKISNGNSSATIKTDWLLKADSFLILCSTGSLTAFSRFGPALAISSFPALNNDAGNIILTTEAGNVMHAVRYDKSWFDNELKSMGGWSLEMIDPLSPCKGKNNWTASHSGTGGTPGKKNSADGWNPDTDPPVLVRAASSDPQNLILLFDKPVDSLTASRASNYTLTSSTGTAPDTGNFPDSSSTLPPFFDHVSLHVHNPMKTGEIYSIAAEQIGNCNGNEFSIRNTCNAGLPVKAIPGDIIFNEILFNPPPYGNDYLELYNRSDKIISCSGLYLAGRDANGNLKNLSGIIKEERDFFPGEYLLLTENPSWVLQQYPISPADQILQVSPMPSLPDDIGKAVLLNDSGEILDELDYDHHWHSPLLANETGVALERIRADLSTALAANWASAAADAGFGTPGYKNSESVAANAVPDLISIEPKIFSPDMDGYQDFCFINYQLPAAGYLGSISIYDVSGRMVRTLANNILWSTRGAFRWDGLDDAGNVLPMGHYIIYVELFLPNGTVKKLKKVCVLARKF